MADLEGVFSEGASSKVAVKEDVDGPPGNREWSESEFANSEMADLESVTSESASSDLTFLEDVISDKRAVEIPELGVEASEVLISEMVDLEGGAWEGAASEAAVTEVANTGNCGGDES